MLDLGKNAVTDQLTRRQIWVNLLLYPSHTLPTAVAPILVAIGLAVHNHVFALVPVLLAFLASWLIHVGGVFTDNFVLITKHADLPEHPELLEALQTGVLTRGGLGAAILACFGGALLMAPPLKDVVGWPVVIVLGAIGVAAAVGYSAGPLPYTRFGLSDLVFFAMFAFVAVPGAYVVQAAASDRATTLASVWRLVPADAFLVGLPIDALVTIVLLIDEIRDASFDRLKGWRTGAVMFGAGWSRAEIAVLSVAAYIAPVWFWIGRGFHPLVLLPLATIPRAYGIVMRVARSSRYEDLLPMTPRASHLAFQYAALLGLGLGLMA